MQLNLTYSLHKIVLPNISIRGTATIATVNQQGLQLYRKLVKATNNRILDRLLSHPVMRVIILEYYFKHPTFEQFIRSDPTLCKVASKVLSLRDDLLSQYPF